jgi:hypothetical protein
VCPGAARRERASSIEMPRLSLSAGGGGAFRHRCHPRWRATAIEYLSPAKYSSTTSPSRSRFKASDFGGQSKGPPLHVSTSILEVLRMSGGQIELTPQVLGSTNTLSSAADYFEDVGNDESLPISVRVATAYHYASLAKDGAGAIATLRTNSLYEEATSAYNKAFPGFHDDIRTEPRLR